MTEDQRPGDPRETGGNQPDSSGASPPEPAPPAPTYGASDTPTVPIPQVPPTPPPPMPPEEAAAAAHAASDTPTVPIHQTPPQPPPADPGPLPPAEAAGVTVGAASAASTESAGGIGGWSTQKKVLAGCGGLILLCVVLSICSTAGLFIAGTFDDDDPTPTLIAIQPTATNTATATATIAPTSTLAPTATSAPTETTAPTETATVAEPTTTLPPTATVPSQGLEILDIGAGQEADGREVGWSFIVQNPDSTQGVEFSEYTVLLKDAAGVVIDSDQGFVNLMFPGETVGVSGTIFLDEGLEASTVEVEIETGTPSDITEPGGFTVSRVTFFPDDSFPSVTGLVENPFNVSFNDLRISAVPYDADGNIIGGGFTFMDIAPAAGTAGVDVSLTSSQQPDRIVVYASLSGLSDPHESDPTDIVVTNAGFGQDDTSVGWAAILQNPTADMRVENPIYQITFFDAEGRVVAVDSNTLITLLGGETLGVGDDLVFLPDGVQVTSIQVDVLTGDLLPDIVGRFSYSDVQYIPDDFFPSVSGVVSNPFDRQMDDLNAFAVLYDEAGNIIGGGRTFMDPLPANGQTLADVSVTGSAVPATVELYATFSFLTDL